MVYATTGLKRSAAFSDVPTIAETYPGFQNSICLGVFAPNGIPPKIVQRLRAEIAKAQLKPSLIDQFNNAGVRSRMPFHQSSFRRQSARTM